MAASLQDLYTNFYIAAIRATCPSFSISFPYNNICWRIHATLYIHFFSSICLIRSNILITPTYTDTPTRTHIGTPFWKCAQRILKYNCTTLHTYTSTCDPTPAIELWSAIELLPRTAQREEFWHVGSTQKVTAAKYISVSWSGDIGFNIPESRRRVSGGVFLKTGVL